MRRPDDLIAFLNQSKYKVMIDNLFEELMEIKKDLMFKMNYIDKYTSKFMWHYNSKCISNYFSKIEDFYSSIATENYRSRIRQIMNGRLPRSDKIKSKNLPLCQNVIQLPFSMSAFEHLKSMKERHNLTMEPEEKINLNDYQFRSDNFPHRLAAALKSKPKSWALHTLGSYYWRMKGNAVNAIECARRGLHFVNREYKDIPLLSLGSILQRSNNNIDALVVFNAAVDHSLDQADNHFALANSLFLLSDFENALQYYDTAVILDNTLEISVIYIKKQLNCFKYVKRRLLSMEDILDEMLAELEKFAARKKVLEECHDNLVKQQVCILYSKFS